MFLWRVSIPAEDNNMAAVWRALSRQGRTLHQLHALTRQPLLQPACFISTSKKNKDVAVPVNPMPKSGELKKLEEHFADSNPESDKVSTVCNDLYFLRYFERDIA